MFFCSLIMCWQSAAARKVYNALRNAIWTDLKNQYGSRPRKGPVANAQNQMSKHNAIWASSLDF
jgi:hypothetical protein